MMNLLIQRIVFRISENAKKWTIVKNKYLVPAPPKKPHTSYILYCNQKRAGKTGTVTEVMSTLAEEWNKLPASAKRKYEEQYIASRAGYEKEIS